LRSRFSYLTVFLFFFQSRNNNERRIGLFGGGIAFPQDYRDDEGEIEAWVGFKRSIEQTELMIEAFEKSRL
jgi:hypothetical protein